MKRVYIAGPMRGIEHYNFPAFDKAAELARSLGFDPVSPADLDRDNGFDGMSITQDNWYDLPESFDLRKTVQRDLAAMLTCDAIAMLPGFERSTGAGAELAVAQWMGLEVLDARTFKPRGVVGIDFIMNMPALQPVNLLAVEDILDEAKRITDGDRQDDYGHPAVEHQVIGDLWGGVLKAAHWKKGDPVPAALVADMMILLKIARNQHKRKRDSYVDIAGYARCGYRITQHKVDAVEYHYAEKAVTR